MCIHQRETSRETSRENGLLVHIFSVSKNKITQPYIKKFDLLLVNDDKMIEKKRYMIKKDDNVQ